MAIQLVRGAQALHEAGVPAQEVRGGTVLLTAAGTAKITGIGLTPSADADPGVADWAATVLELCTSDIPVETDSAGAELQRAVAVLGECLAAEPADPRAIAEQLITRFAEQVGMPYPRPAPVSLDPAPDQLNNLALSLLALGLADEAEVTWAQALRIDPRHPDATFNQGLARWRQARNCWRG